jgi:peptidyl-prolyl cis-trans isomerase C
MEEGNVDKILEEHKKVHPQIKLHRRKPVGLIIATLILALIVIILGATLLMSFNPLNSIAKTYNKDYPGSQLSIQKISGNNSQVLNSQIINYCPDFKLNEYYLAQIENSAAKQSFLFVINPKSGKIECKIDKNPPASTSTTGQRALSQNLLATINGEPIYKEDVMAVYNNIPAASRTNTSMQDSLEQIIGDKLLIQDATAKGFNVSDEEVNNAINAFLTSNSLTIDQLGQRLATIGSSIDLFRNNTRKTLLLQKEISEVTKDATLPTDADIQKYYNDNPQLFVTKAQASTRQLLIYANQSNDAEKLAQVKGIATMLNATNFCELVSTYSQDAISASRCGQYDFEPGQLLPEYEQVVFNSTPGSTKIVKTRIGYHIVQIINVVLPREISFDQAKASIANFLLLKNKQDLLVQYVAKLRQQAKIESYI